MLKTNSVKIALIVFTILSTLSVLNSGKPKNNFIPYKETAFLGEKDKWADSVLSTLTTQQKIAQLFIAKLDNEWEAKQLISKYHIGGFSVSSSTQNDKTTRLQGYSNIPLLVALSQSSITMGGKDEPYPAQNILGHISDDSQIFEIGKSIGAKLKANGINMFIGGYANLSPDSEFSFGTNKYHVSRLCMQLHEGMEQNRILSASGLFPFTEVINTDKKSLDSIYLMPFRRLISNGVAGMIISPHVFRKENTEAGDSSLSFHSAESILRKRLDFEGLVISFLPDSAKNIMAIQTIESINHGANLIFNIKDIPYTISKVSEAVENNTISKRTLNARCKKVLLAKSWIMTNEFISTKTPTVREEEILLHKMAKESFTILKNEENYLPIQDLSSRSFVSIHFGETDISPFQEYLSKYAQFEHLPKQAHIERDSIAQLIAYLSSYQNVILSIDGKFSKPESFTQALSVLGSQSNLTIIALGKDFSLDTASVTHAKAFSICPSPNIENQETAAQIIFGALPAKGIIPAQYTNYPPYSGIRYKAIGRLRYNYPEEEGVNYQLAHDIDSIANIAVARGATPGCQVLVAKNGAVILEKSYGYHTFDKQIAVENSHIYDLASITKVAASTISLMHLTDEGSFDIHQRLDKYLPYLDSTDKGEILLSDILTHQARLHPWIPFYLTLIEGYDNPDIELSAKRKSKDYSVKAGNNFYIKTDYKFRDSLVSDSMYDPYTIY